MRATHYLKFVADVRRYRPLAIIALSALVVAPAFPQVISQELSTTEFLGRFAEAMAAISVLVWAVSSLVIRYAMQHVRAELGPMSARDAND